MITVNSTDKDEPLKAFDQKALKLNSIPKQYREVSCEGTLEPGTYVIVVRYIFFEILGYFLALPTLGNVGTFILTFIMNAMKKIL